MREAAGCLRGLLYVTLGLALKANMCDSGPSELFGKIRPTLVCTLLYSLWVKKGSWEGKKFALIPLKQGKFTAAERENLHFFAAFATPKR